MTDFTRYTLLLRGLIVAATVVASLMVGSVLYYLVVGHQDWHIVVLSMEDIPADRGGMCSFPYYYDSDGNKIDPMEVLREDYIGDAPIFMIPPIYPITSTEYLCGYPDIVTSSLVLMGQPFYPLYLTAGIPRETFKIGESAQLIATASIGDYFSKETNSVWYSVPITPSETMTVVFELAAANFIVSPLRTRSDVLKMSMAQPASSIWVIAPNDTAGGDQSLIVSLLTGKKPYPYELIASFVHVEVRPSSGLNPTFVALMGTLGTFIISLIGIIKVFPSIWDSYESTFASGRKKKPIGFKTTQETHK